MTNPYLDLTEQFNRGRRRALVSSRQAVVLHRLACGPTSSPDLPVFLRRRDRLWQDADASPAVCARDQDDDSVVGDGHGPCVTPFTRRVADGARRFEREMPDATATT
jgi:hypothetical protein